MFFFGVFKWNHTTTSTTSSWPIIKEYRISSYSFKVSDTLNRVQEHALMTSNYDKQDASPW